MLMSFLYWFGDGSTILDVPVAADEDLVLTLPSMVFSCPMSMPAVSESASDDDDDQDVEFVEGEDQDNESASDPAPKNWTV